MMRADTLSRKLLTMDVSSSLITLVISFLNNREQCVRLNESISKTKASNLGVPQGIVSGPLLWNIFVTTLKPAPNTVKYADGTTPYCVIEKKLLCKRYIKEIPCNRFRQVQ